MIPQSPAPAATAGGPSPHKNFLDILAQVDNNTVVVFVLLLLFIMTILLIYLLFTRFCLVWRDHEGYLRRFRWFERAFEALDERKTKRILKELPPAVKFEARDGTVNNPCTGGCAICLEDFKDGELCQVLPLCDHAFHSGCVRPWLITNQSCPNCRTLIHGQS